jgi:hypothetical protein
MQPAVEQNENERDRTEPEGERVVLECNAADAFGSGEHADDQKHQGHWHGKSFGCSAEDDAEREQNAERREKERRGQWLGAGHVSVGIAGA